MVRSLASVLMQTTGRERVYWLLQLITCVCTLDCGVGDVGMVPFRGKVWKSLEISLIRQGERLQFSGGIQGWGDK